jgi:hypothetical protein
MTLLRLVSFIFVISLASCATSGLHEGQRRRALPANEIQRKPQTLVGRGISNPHYDVYRFSGWLSPEKSPRQFDLYLPKNRSKGKATIREVTSADTKPATGRTMTASIDMRYTSNMLLTDPVFRKKSDLAIGESVACKGNCVSVSLREGEAIHHWDAKLRLEWVKRDKTDQKINNALYAVTVPLDAAGYVAEALINGALDDDD